MTIITPVRGRGATDALKVTGRLLDRRQSYRVVCGASWLQRTHTETSMIFEPQHEHDLTPKTLKYLATDNSPETVRILNVLKTIRTLVESKGAQLPYLLPIGERAEAIAEAFQKRQNTTQEALQALYKLAEEYEKSKDRKGG